MNSIAQIWQANRRIFANNYKEKETLLEGPSNHAPVSLTVSISEGSNNQEKILSSPSFQNQLRVCQSMTFKGNDANEQTHNMPSWNQIHAQLLKVWGVMSSRTAFNTSGALQDPVPTSLHFKKFFSRSSCSGHRVLEGTGSACKHVLSVLYVHCCELGKA
jgi:hypothetical protein